MYFLNFIYNTIHKRAKDPSNDRFWLPKVLENVEGPERGKLLPMHGKNWELGTIGGEAGLLVKNTMVSQWQFVLQGTGRGELLAEHEAIACPDKPDPNLSFPEVTINGLHNVYAHDNPLTSFVKGGYETTITLQFGYYDGSEGRPELIPFGLSGKYLLQQCLCLAEIDSASICSGVLSQTINGTGDFTAVITNAFAETEVFIEVVNKGNLPQLKAMIKKLTLRGKAEGSEPDIELHDLTIDTEIKALRKLWISAAENAITSPEGRAGLFANVEATLNQEESLAQLSKVVTERLQSGLDDMVGKPSIDFPEEQPTIENPVDQYLFDRLRVAFNDPESSWYLPRTIIKMDNPTFEPYQLEEVQLPDQEIFGATVREVKIHNLVFNGFSNTLTPMNQMVFQKESELSCRADLCAMTNPPKMKGLEIAHPPIKSTGRFSMTHEGTVIGEGFEIIIRGGHVHFQVYFSGKDVDDLKLKVKSLKLAIAPDQMEITVNNSAFKEIINQVLNTEQTKKKVIEEMNRWLELNKKRISNSLLHPMKYIDDNQRV